MEMNSTLRICTAKAEYQNVAYASYGHPLTLVSCICYPEIHRKKLQNVSRGFPRSPWCYLWSTLMQFQNKELVCTFSCVYLSLLHPDQNKRVYRLNTYRPHMPTKWSSPGFADLYDYFPFIVGFAGLILSADCIFIIVVLKQIYSISYILSSILK